MEVDISVRVSLDLLLEDVVANSDLYLTRLTVPLCYMSTMLHYKTVPFALPLNDNDRYRNGLQCQLSAILAHDVDDQMGLC